MAEGNSYSALATTTLVDMASGGDARAVESICARFRPRLVRWAHGRLPEFARGMIDTEDLVQDSLLRSIEQLPRFEQRGPDGFLYYVRTAIQNRIKNEIKAAKRRPVIEDLKPDFPSPQPSPYEHAVRHDEREQYEAALRKLSAQERELVIGRLEMQMSDAELALHTGKPSADAARMACKRAIAQMTKLLT